MRLLELSFLAATLFSTAWANDPKCPLQVPSPFCRYDKSRPEYAKCSLPDRLLYQNDTRKDTVSYQCPAEAGGEPIELVASKSHYRNDYLWNALYEDWDEPIVTYIRKYFEDWPTFSEQMGFRENPVYSVKMPYMKFFDKSTLTLQSSY